MVIWYIIGYFVIGLIIVIADRVGYELRFNKSYYEVEDPGPQLMFHAILIILIWPLILAVVSVIVIDKSLSVLSKWLAKQIKERSKHER